MTTDFVSTFDGTAKALIGYDMNVQAAQRVYQQSGLGPDDFQVIELHDRFSANGLLLYEALGLCGEGEAPKLIDNGDTTSAWAGLPSSPPISGPNAEWTANEHDRGGKAMCATSKPAENSCKEHT